MEKEVVFAKVLALVTPFCKNENALQNVNEHSRFLEDLKVNSARLVDIILAIEDEFNIEVDDAAADDIRTMGDAVHLIMEKTLSPA
jgi:acyl carrier protein